MQVKVSRTMAKVLNSEIKEYNIQFKLLTSEAYRRFVDSYIFDHDNDFDYKSCKYNVILVEYPVDYYANSMYLTTNDLLRIYRKSDKTYVGFIEGVKNEIEI